MSTLKPSKRAVILQERDFALLKEMFESRVMTGAHVASIYFDGKKESAKKRLQKLKSAGYVGERARMPNEQAILSLTAKGLKLLKEHGILTDYPPASIKTLEKRARVSNITLRHELEVMDVKTAFYAAIQDTNEFSIAEFTTWTQMHQFKAVPSRYDGVEVMVKPDGFIRIHETKDGETFEQTFFLEVDRSTEMLDTLVSKAASYRDYQKSGGFAERSGAARSAANDLTFRVLMVFKTPERRNNAAERMLEHNPPILGLVFLSTLEEVLNDPLGKIWFRPSDYREAVRNTPFGNTQARMQLRFQRSTARDLFVEKNVRKWRIHIEESQK
jgi:hypothetical protein